MTISLLHLKPVAYGSALADAAFLILLTIHVVIAAAALVSGIVAMLVRKGGRRHLAAGDWFVRTMVATALTGAAVGAIRLAVAYEANHTQYLGTSMPSTIPARIGFLYAAACIVYMSWGVRARLVERRSFAVGGRVVPGLLVAIGAGSTLGIGAWLNPWTGALWMIWTFMGAVALTAHYRRDLGTRSGRVREHRFVLLFLGAFSWWGALQGFGPAIGMAFSEVGAIVAPYTGDQPGPFHPRFFAFLVFWMPAYVFAGWLGWRFFKKSKRADLVPG